MPERIAANKLTPITTEPLHNVLINSFIEKPHFKSSLWQSDGESCGVFYPPTGFCLYQPNVERFEPWAQWLFQQKIQLVCGELNTHYSLLKQLAELPGQENLNCRFEIQEFCYYPQAAIPNSAVNKAGAEHLEQLVEFYAQSEDMTRSKEELAETLVAGRILFLEVEGKIVSSALTHREASNAALIGGVYTSTECRGKGYSQVCVSSLCFDLQQDGKTPCLFYERENQEAKTLYQKLGFVYYGDWIIAEIHYQTSN